MLRVCSSTSLTFGLFTACTGVADVIALALRTASPSAAESEDSTYAPSDSGDASSEDWASVEDEGYLGSGGASGTGPGLGAGESGDGVPGGSSGGTPHPGGTAAA